VYWGDADQLRALLPDPKAAIFVSDYKGNNLQKLADYLTYLSTNQTAYEEHRNWRKTFNSLKNRREKPLLRETWECRVCNWALEETQRRKKETSSDKQKRTSSMVLDKC
jgi:Glycosyltransferase family 10 (fucosyltransferase) C-term